MPKEKKSPSSIQSKQSKLAENLYRTTSEYVQGRKYKALSFEALMKNLSIHPPHADLFKEVLNRIELEGNISLVNGLYAPVQNNLQNDLLESSTSIDANLPQTNNNRVVQGKIKVHPRGFGFVQPDDGTDDIFIPKPYVGGAIDLDTVSVEITAVQERGPEGKVLQVLERNRSLLAGTIIYGAATKYEVFSSSFGDKQSINCTLDEKMHDVPAIGDRVLVAISEWGSKQARPQGSITKIIGSIKDPSSDIPFAICDLQIPHIFPKNVVEEAKGFGDRVTPKEIVGRLDLRELNCFTIDPDTAKDFDDAVSLEKTKTGYRLGVHIADVSHYVKEGSALDKEARNRCNSTYFPGVCIPMLPHELSNNLCSLREGVNRLTVSVFINLKHDGSLIDWEISRSVIRSKKRLTYKQAKEILDGKRKSSLKPILEEMVVVAKLLQEKRSERGSVQLCMPELIIKVDKDGVPTGTERVEYDITHQLIEEFMLKANEVVAIHLSREGKNVSFRIHEEPAQENLDDFAALVTAFGFNLNKKPTPYDIQNFFLSIEGSPHAQYLASCYIRSMRLATYSPDNIGHYGLSLEHYCHFTSPIRRYVDTIIHRLLCDGNIDRKDIEEISKKSSDRERTSARAEMSVVQLKKLRLIQDMKKKGELKTVMAIITRVKPFGFFFDIMDYMLEGFAHISEIGDDYYTYVEAKSRMMGMDTGETFSSGDKIYVELKGVDLIRAEATWKLLGKVESSASNGKSSGKSKAHGKKSSKKKTQSLKKNKEMPTSAKTSLHDKKAVEPKARKPKTAIKTSKKISQPSTIKKPSSKAATSKTKNDKKTDKKAQKKSTSVKKKKSEHTS